MRVLITGANSYIGTSFVKYIKQLVFTTEHKLEITTISQRGEAWRIYDFSGYDSVFHVTGIAHADLGGMKQEAKELYYKINCDLACETMEKASKEGVGQFIYISSMIVYGNQVERITKDTVPQPSNFYGDSKWRGEEKLRELAKRSSIKLVILRPPMIYGKESKGNYPLLAKMAGKLPIFPLKKNERSMLYIENLCECVRILIETKREGIFFPQNAAYVSTSEMVAMIAETKSKKIWRTHLLTPMVSLLEKCPGKIGGMTKKAFGSFTYDLEMSKDPLGYQIYNLRESIEKTEK